MSRSRVFYLSSVLGAGGSGVDPLALILDLDLDSDCDDLHDVAVLCELARQNECDIAAVTLASNNDYAAPAARVLLDYAAAPAFQGVPVGAYQGSSIGGGSDSLYTEELRDEFGDPSDDDRTNYDDAVDVLRQALADAADASVKIVVTGTLTNISALLQSSADGISALNGSDLVALKCISMHIAAGRFPTGGAAPGDEHNISFDVEAANYVAANSPVPLYWADIDIGDTVNCKFPTYADPDRDPFKVAWDLSVSQHDMDGNRPAWGALAVLHAVRGESDLFGLSNPGDVEWDDETFQTAFVEDAGGNSRYLTKVASDATFEALINGLIADLTQASDVLGPVFESGASFTADDDAQLAHSLVTNETATFSVVGGADQAHFEISGSTLRWASNGTRDFDNPQDANTNNIYEVTVRATDTKGNTTDQNCSVQVLTGAFTPLALSPDLWVAADDLSTLFQSNAGTTAVATDNDVVGFWSDKSGNNFHLNSNADDTTRPTYNTEDFPHVLFDGSNDALKRLANLGMYNAGACSIFLALRGNPAVARTLVGEGGTDSDTLSQLVRNDATTASTAYTLVRNDAGTVLLTNTLGANVFNNADHVYGWVWDGATINTFLDGSALGTRSLAAGGTLTTDRFSLGSNWRQSSGLEGFFAGRVYECVIVKRAINSTERGNLTTYLGNKIGLTI